MPHQVPHVEDTLHSVRLAGTGRPLDHDKGYWRHPFRSSRPKMRRRKLRKERSKLVPAASELLERRPLDHDERHPGGIKFGAAEQVHRRKLQGRFEYDCHQRQYWIMTNRWHAPRLQPTPGAPLRIVL